MIYIVRQGKEGAEEIKKMMDEFRANPPKTIGGSPIVTIKDYLSSEALDVQTGNRTPIEMEKSNVLQFFTEDNTIVSIRPSGTEPKIKFYFGVREELPSKEQFYTVQQKLDDKLQTLETELTK